MDTCYPFKISFLGTGQRCHTVNGHPRVCTPLNMDGIPLEKMEITFSNQHRDEGLECEPPWNSICLTCVRGLVPSTALQISKFINESRNFCTALRGGTIEKLDNSKCGWGHGEITILIRSWLERKMMSCFEKSLEAPQMVEMKLP